MCRLRRTRHIKAISCLEHNLFTTLFITHTTLLNSWLITQHPMAPLKILICGGGIAGNALAFWLSKLGHQVTVLERFSTLRTTGLQLDLRGHGVQVLRRMGLDDKFRARAVAERGLRVIDKSGSIRGYFPANDDKSGKALQSFTTEYEIMRGDLCQMLYEENRDRVKYVFGAAVDSVTNDGKEAVDVSLTNGDRDHFDLVVGADGVGSQLRKKLFRQEGQPDAFRPIKDLYTAYFTIPRKAGGAAAVDDNLATVYMTAGGRNIMIRTHRPDVMQVYLSCKSDSKKLKDCRPGDVNTEKEAFAEIYKGAGWKSEDIIKSMFTDADDFYCERMGLVQLDSWSRNGRVTLVGDACYCPSANTGMGTTSAFVGAYILAGEISKHCGKSRKTDASSNASNLSMSLKAYEDRFRPFMTQVQQDVSEGLGMPTSAFGIAVLNLIISLASWMKWNLFGSMISRENIKNWGLPEYEELAKAVKADE